MIPRLHIAGSFIAIVALFATVAHAAVPPVDSAANEALVRFLAETLSCSRGAVAIIRGQTSRHKQVLITGLPPETIVQRLTR